MYTWCYVGWICTRGSSKVVVFQDRSNLQIIIIMKAISVAHLQYKVGEQDVLQQQQQQQYHHYQLQQQQTHTRARTHARTYTQHTHNTHTHTHTRTHARTHAHAHTHKHTHTHTHTHTLAPSLPPSLPPSQTTIVVFLLHNKQGMFSLWCSSESWTWLNLRHWNNSTCIIRFLVGIPAILSCFPSFFSS